MNTLNLLTIEDVVNIKKGKKPKTLVETNNTGFLPYLTASYFRTGEIEKYVDPNENVTQITPTDTVIIWDGSNSGEVFNGLSGVLASTMARIEVKEEFLLQEFLYYFLKSKFKKLNTETTGSTIPHVSRNVLNSLVLPQIEIRTQKKIAYILSTIQNKIENIDKQIQSYTDFKKSVMEKLFTEGLRGEKQKDTEIGMIPESWEVKELYEIANVEYGIQAAVAKNTDPAIGPPILTNKNIDIEGFIDLSELSYYDLQNDEKKYLLQKGDILFNWRSGSAQHVGKSAIFDLDGVYTHSSFILRIRTGKEINRYYLNYLLSYMKLKGLFLTKRSQSSINSVLNKSTTQKLAIFLPSKKEQKEIVRKLEILDRKINIMKAKLRANEDLFMKMLHNLMNQEIKVDDFDINIEESEL
jgi:type I restriction enzyme S subunit